MEVESGINPVVILIAAMAISMVVIPLMRRFAPVLGMMDRPDSRKVHTVPVARVGGWGIVLGGLIPVVIWAPMTPLVQSFLFGAFVLLVFGSWDDCREIGHYLKFAGQFLAVIPVVVYGDLYVERIPFMGADTIAPAFGIPFSIFAMVGMINAINHSDGLDGLAGGEALLSLIVIALIAYLYDGSVAMIIASAAIGGVLGFLRYNTHPARVFMGDAGSQFLGFALGFLAILLTQDVNSALSPAIPALLLGLPIVDILAVFAQRAYHGMNWFRASRNHIHHRLLDLNFDHYETVVVIYSIQALFVISAIFLRYEWDYVILGLYFGVCATVFALLLVAERTGWCAHRRDERSRLAITVARIKQHRLFTHGPLLLVAVAVPAYVFFGGLWSNVVPRDFGVVSAVLFIALLLAMIFGKGGNSLMTRAAVYATAMFIVYLTVNFPPVAYFQMRSVEVVYFVVLAGAISVSVRFTTDWKFRTTPMDYLILFIVVTIGIFSERNLQGYEFGPLVIKGMIILYGCELLISKMGRRWSGLSLSSLATLAVLGMRGLFVW